MEQDWHVGYTFIASPGQPPRRFESENAATAQKDRASAPTARLTPPPVTPTIRLTANIRSRTSATRRYGTNPIEAQPREREREDEDKKARQVSRHLSSAASRVTRARSSGSINCTTYSR
jgi:hypothetical protein